MNQFKQRILILAIIVLTGSMITSSGIAGEELNWRTDYRKAYQESRETGKPLLLKFTAPWCVFCHKMKKSFADETVTKQVEKNFIPVIVNSDNEKKLSEALEVKGLPTTVILTADLDVAGQITGFLPPAKLLKSLNKITQNLNNEQSIEQTSLQKEHKSESAKFEFEGTCLVSLQSSKKVLDGDEKYLLDYHGYKLLFTSEKNKEEFENSPEKYWPALNGYCPVAAAGGIEKKGNAKLAAFYKGKIWFFANKDNRSRFATNPRIYLKALDNKDLLD